MKKLNREKVIRMVGGEINNRIGISSSGGSGGGGLAGAATQAWVDANYVSIEFFDRLFQAYSGTGSSATRVNANDTESTIDNIKAMFGFWTEQYLSTLGQGSGGGGGGGASSLSDLLDVELTTLQNGQALVYSSALGKWTNGTAGVNMTQVWSALDSATNEQINVSHLTNALSGYVTTSAISDMATQTWVGQQGYATQTWVGQNYISIAYFDRLFRAYNGSTLVNHNDTTTTIDNIKSMFGFWTDFYLSALGNGGQAGGAIYLSQLADVVLSSPTDGQALIYDAANSQWVNGTVAGVTSLSALSDVTIISLQANQALVYNATAGRWENTSLTSSLLSDFAISSPATHQVLMYDTSTTKWYNSDLKTINGQSIYGSGDISVGGGASGNYLPLTGGTLTNTLPSSSGVLNITGTGTYNVSTNKWWYSLFCMTSGLTTGHRNNIAIGQSFSSKNCGIMSYMYNGSGSNDNYLSFGMHSVDDLLNLYGSRKVQIKGNSGDGIPALEVNCTPNNDTWYYCSSFLVPNISSNKWAVIGVGQSYSMGNYGLLAFNYVGNNSANNCLSLAIYGNNGALSIYKGYRVVVNGESMEVDIPRFSIQTNSTSTAAFNYSLWALCSGLTAGKRNAFALGQSFSQRNAGIVSFYYAGSNSTSNFLSFGLHSADNVLNVYGNGCVGVNLGTAVPSYTLHVSGNIYATGGVTALSDARHKTIIKDAGIDVEQIARMRAVLYKWNDGREDNALHVGSIAQDWQTVLPEVVLRANDKEGTLSMQYGVAALVSSIITARKVVDHERRIAELEKENKELKLKLKIA